MTTQPEDEREVAGHRLLSAVERLLAETGSLVALSNDCMRRAKGKKLGDEAKTTAEAAAEVVRHFSNLSAISGGATALPAMLPGIGTAVALTGGALTDVAFLLKFEVEMALVLTHLHGFDIRDEKERELAFLMASVSTYEAQGGRNFFVDIAEAQGVALANYAPREVSKVLLVTLAKLATSGVGKGLARAVPLLGIAVGASFNKVLTRRVGQRCIVELSERVKTAPASGSDDVVDAKVSEGGS